MPKSELKAEQKAATASQLVVAVSSRALFDLESEHRLFEEKGYKAFRDYQVAHQNDPLTPGVAFPFVKRLLGLNELFPDRKPFRVVALSRNSPETARRFFNSCRHYNLPINAGAFTSGQSTFPFLKAFKVSLFLSANAKNVERAVRAGLPGGLVLPNPMPQAEAEDDPTLRIAFDFDGVLADDESEREYQRGGLTAFEQHEIEKADTPLAAGPLQDLFEKLSAFQKLDYELHGRSDPYFRPAIRISIVTSRGAQSEARLINSLKSFGMTAAELFLLDGLSKEPILEAIRPHIFFDDQARHLEDVRTRIPSVLVPFGIHNEPRPA